MSYYLQVLKDTPQNLFMLDGNFVNGSGRGTAGIMTGTPSYESTALVANANRSATFSASSYLGVPFPYASPGFERQAFSLEAWVLPTNQPAYVMGHSGDADLLYWTGTQIYFSLRLNGTLVSVKYTPETSRAMHVVATYNGTAMTLYVNGVQRDSYTLTATQMTLPITLSLNNGYIYSGAQVIAVQAVATYYVVLNSTQVYNHYRTGLNTLTTLQATAKFGGVYEKINTDTADLFLDTTLSTSTEFSVANYTCSVAEDKIQAARNSTGAYLASTWQAAIDISAGGTSINGINVYWEGSGTYTLETSPDGTTWSSPANNFRLAAYSQGYDTTGKFLYIRVTFTAGQYGEVTKIAVTGFKTMTVVPSRRPITLPATATLYDESPIMEYNITNGVNIAGGITIGATADSTAAYALGFWYYCGSGSITDNITPTTFYENGAARAERTIVGQWAHFLIVFPAKTDAITISGNAILAGITVYESTLTAAQVLEIYQSFTGIPAYTAAQANTLTVDSPTAQVYANDWAITGAG